MNAISNGGGILDEYGLVRQLDREGSAQKSSRLSDLCSGAVAELLRATISCRTPRPTPIGRRVLPMPCRSSTFSDRRGFSSIEMERATDTDQQKDRVRQARRLLLWQPAGVPLRLAPAVFLFVGEDARTA
jgi:hypothetical protein